MNNYKRKEILISGAGIGGPALAYWLSRHNYMVTIVEKAPAVRTGGYRIDIRGTAVSVIRQMGLLHKIKEEATDMLGSSIVNRDGKRIVNMDDPNLFGMREGDDIEIMRGDLVNILYNITKEDTTYLFNDSIAAINENADGVTVTFKSGAVKNYDLVVAADGLHSKVRKLVFGEEQAFIKNMGASICIFTMSNQFNIDRWELTYHAAGKIINVYSTHNGAEAKVFMMYRSGFETQRYHSIQQQKEAVAQQFNNAGWKADVILQGMYQAKDFYFDILGQVQMNELHKGRVVLLGDAGYCPSPASGQGSSMALVGAYVLAGELAAAGDDYRRGFMNYQEQMKTYVAANQQLGIEVLKEMVPASARQVWFQNRMLRLILALPWREKLIRGMLKKVQKSVTSAANGIRLKAYS